MLVEKKNFPKNRYKFGKQKHAITINDFQTLLKKTEVLNTQGFYYLRKNGLLSVQSLLSAYYWLGVRKTELVGCNAKGYILPPCNRHDLPIEKIGELHQEF